MKTLIFTDGVWVEGEPSNGDRVKFELDSGGSVINASYYKETKEDVEISWRDSELERTDKLVVLPDYPRGARSKQEFLDYRQALADYHDKDDFPNGTRPSL